MTDRIDLDDDGTCSKCPYREREGTNLVAQQWLYDVRGEENPAIDLLNEMRGDILRGEDTP